ncbi:restriction endonuclease subunit S [Pseudomonas putida]|jgi:type I restriction enzyme S subunit|uniref:restriction endonuclease subunit S n=1 Tax=Pseudomonas putida TaxID=303 RepID=UPI001F51B577|nr:restriction endonuclease subunit S [Pseudomonas putida]MCI1021589.1 restriction endonuclease subunit S [Pseudomonas putida]
MTELLIGNLPLLASAPNGIKKLRELILELAVRGKLVPQDPNDEPASELLKRIIDEKARLISTEKTKKQKPHEVINVDSTSFGQPRNWELVRLSELIDPRRTITYGVLKPGVEDPNGIPLVKAENIQFNHVLTDFKSRITPELNEEFRRTKLVGGEILLTLVGSIGRCAIAPRELAGANLSRSVGLIVPLDPINKAFVVYMITALINQDFIDANCAGTAQKVLNVGTVNDLVLPLPPLAEQHRIVDKVNELMDLCDRLEARQANAESAHAQLVQALLESMTQAIDATDFDTSWQRLSDHFHTLFITESSIDALKKTVLQLAVMGKLVPQDPTDESASELIKRIQAEKLRLVAEGKIKKLKPQAEISDEEKLFSLPEGWRWARLGEIGISATGKTPSTNNTKFFGGSLQFIGPGQISVQGEITEAEKWLTELARDNTSVAEPGDLLMVCIGGSIGKCAIADREMAYNQQINSTRILIADHRYIFKALSSPTFKSSLLASATGTATPIINRSKWDELLVPVPPHREQQRIVAKTDQLITICDTLKQQINLAIDMQSTILNALTAQI